MASAAASGRSRNPTTCRQISTSMVANSDPPRMSTTPKEVKQNRKTIEAAAPKGGAEQREGDGAERLPAARPEETGRLFQSGIEVLPEAAQRCESPQRC